MKYILLKFSISAIICSFFMYFMVKTNNYNFISFICGAFYMGLYLGICESINKEK